MQGLNNTQKNTQSWKCYKEKIVHNPWVLGAGVFIASTFIGGALGGLIGSTLGAITSVVFSSSLIRNTEQRPQTNIYIPPVTSTNQTLASGNCTNVVGNLTRYCSAEREALANATAMPIHARQAQANSSYSNSVNTAQGDYSRCALENAQSLNTSLASNSSANECDVLLMQQLAQESILQNPGNATQGENARQFLNDLQAEHPEKVDNATLQFYLNYSAEDLWVGASNSSHSDSVDQNWNQGNGTFHKETFIHPDTNKSMTTLFHTHFSPSNITTAHHLVIIAPGRGENEDAYKEMVFDLNRQGIDTLVLGFEGNRNDTGHKHLGHIDDFYQAYVAPIDACIKNRNNMTNRHYDKVVLVGHSTGGNAVVQSVERGNKSEIAKVILLSPMLKINQPNAKLDVASALQNAYEALIKPSDETSMPSIYLPGYKVRKRGAYSGNKNTHSQVRYNLKEQSNLQTPPTAPTLKWIQQAAKATQLTQDIKAEETEDIDIYQIFTASKDTIVNNHATYGFAKKINASLSEFEVSGHSLHLETDCVRLPIVESIVGFAQAGNTSLDRLQLAQEQIKLLNPCLSKRPLRFNNLEESSPTLNGAIIGTALGAVGAGIISTVVIASTKQLKSEDERSEFQDNERESFI